MREQVAIVQPRDLWGLAARVVLLAAALGVGLWLLVTLRSIVLLILLAIIVAAGLGPLVDRLQRAGLPRALAVLLIYLGFILAILVLGVLVVPPIVRQAEQEVGHAPEYVDLATQWLRDLHSRFPFLPPLDQLSDQLQQQVGGLEGQIGGVLANALAAAGFALELFNGLFSMFLLLLVTFHLLVDGGKIREYFLSLLAPDRRQWARSVTDHMSQRMGGWLLGQVTLSAVVGLASFIGLAVLGVPGAALLAVIAAIGEFIPMVGPIIGAVPAVIAAALQSPFQGVATLVLYLVIQQLENNLLAPKIVGRAVQLHALAVVLSLTVGAALLGLVGALVAVPLTAAVAVVLDELRHAHAGDVPAAANQDDAAAPRGHESEAGGAAVHTSAAHQSQDAGAART